jgi:hypothetical protein
MKCNICGSQTSKIFTKKLLFQYEVDYFRCHTCLFVQTEQPYWLDEAYSSAITSLDIGLVSRNKHVSVIVEGLINAFFDKNGNFLDYGGGYGLLVRMLRDKGFNFYREDKYCENLFAKNFDVTDIEDKSAFELLSAFELFEHLPDPLAEINAMLCKSENILFSTDLQPNKGVEDWEYIAPEIGQHVSFYHYETLMYIGKKFQMNVYSNKKNIHLLTRKKLNSGFFTLLTRPKAAKFYNLFASSGNSLLLSDYDMVKQKLKRSHADFKHAE